MDNVHKESAQDRSAILGRLLFLNKSEKRKAYQNQIPAN